MKILVVGAHPDDETSAAGGTTAKYVSLGYIVDLVTATGGEKGTRLGVPEGVENRHGAGSRATRRRCHYRYPGYLPTWIHR